MTHPRTLFLGLAAVFTLAGGCRDAEVIDTRHWPSHQKPFPWRAQVTLPKPPTARPGGELSATFSVTADLRAHRPRHGTFTHLIVALTAPIQHDRDGRYRSGRSSGAVSTNFTVAGVPVEYFDGWPRIGKVHGRDGVALEATRSFKLSGDVARVHELSGTLRMELPQKLPHGHYRPQVFVLARIKGVAEPVHLAAFADNWNEARYMLVLPLVRIGRPATPRLPWTILSQVRYRGQAGVLSDEDRRHVGLVPRAGFYSMFIIRPGRYRVAPDLPTVFPKRNMPFVAGGDVVIPEFLHNHLRPDAGKVSLKIKGPDGTVKDAGVRRVDFSGANLLRGGGFLVDMTRTGRYQLTLKGHMEERHGRRMTGGGTYTVHVANPLSFSTSCKPGSSFLVGSAYPPKVNVNPPFPATVEVRVDYYPGSDPARKRRWEARGRANRFGHFVPRGKASLRFDEPGEYHSRVVARYTDARGQLWMAEQSSTGVIAPRSRRTVRLHGTRSFPYGLRAGEAHNGGVKRFRDRPDMSTSFLPENPTMLPDPYVPYDPRDSLFSPTGGYHESLIEPHFSMDVRDPKLRARLLRAHSVRSFLVPPMYQPSRGPWRFLRGVVQLSTDSGGWFPADKVHDELPVLPVSGAARLHPFAHPKDNRVEAYTIMGVFRPGLPVMTAVHQRDAIGLYWVTSPNRFADHFNNGPNGDLPGDLYRVQAGLVLKDRVTGNNHYDAYSAAMTVTPPGVAGTAIRPPGERPLVVAAGREHRLFLATDTHDTVEVGEHVGLGGMVFPAVEAEVTWTVTTPDGRVVVSRGRADRLGGVRGKPMKVDRPGLYRVKVGVRHGKLRGDIVGTVDGTYFVAAVARDNAVLLKTTLGPVTRVDAREGLRIPLTWPAGLKDVRLRWGVIMPGQVLDQGQARPTKTRYAYPFEPVHLASQFSNFDVRSFSTGRWALADTVVFQFFLEATAPGKGRVYDALRLVARRDRLFNYRKLMRRAGPRGAGHPAKGHPDR